MRPFILIILKFRKIFLLLIFIISLGYSQIDVACLGNSITQGHGLPVSENYPSQLEILLGSGYNVTNYGEAGRTVVWNEQGWAYAEVPPFESPEWRFSTATPHNIVILLFGTNDSNADYSDELSHFKEDYLDLIDDYKNYPGHEDPVFVLGLPPPVFDESLGHRNTPIVNTIIPLIRQIANESGLEIANFYSAMADHPELFSDGVHPNATGAAVMANVAYSAIQKAIAQSGPNPPIPSAPPQTPSGFLAIPQLNSIKLIWNPNTETNLAGYHLYRGSGDAGIQYYLATISFPNTTFIDINVTPAQVYSYSISAYNTDGKISSRSISINATTLDLIPPAQPSTPLIVHTPDTVKISWISNSETDLFKYYVYRHTESETIRDANNIITNILSPDTSYTDTSVQVGTLYYYGITAVDVSGNQSDMSPISSIHTTSPPVSQDTTITFLEDIPHSFNALDFPFSDVDNHQLEKIIFIDSEQFEYFQYDNNTVDSTIVCEELSKLTFNSILDESGENYAEFKYRLIDSFGHTSIDTNNAIINVASVNDAPTIDPITDIELMEDSKNILINISGITAGPTNENQSLTIKAFANAKSLVTTDSIQYNSRDENGVISISPIENIFGIIPMNIQVIDDGGTENGGIDTITTNFNLDISPINDPPLFNLLNEIEILEDSETTIQLTGIKPGLRETGQYINMSVESNNIDVLPHPIINYISPNTTANIILSTINNVHGTTSITISMSDDSGTAFGGKDAADYTIPVKITSVNDKPSSFNISIPQKDTTLVINKTNYLKTLAIIWETSSDIDNDAITYNVIFSDELSELSRYKVNTTKVEYQLKDILAVTDTISISNGTYSVIATDGKLETSANNSGLKLLIDGRSFAPAKLHLDQNYPNPFNRSTLVGFDLPKRTEVTIVIFDLLGEEIIKLVDKKIYDRGYNTITWSGFDKNSKHIPAGMYIMQIRTNSEEMHKKLIYLK